MRAWLVSDQGSPLRRHVDFARALRTWESMMRRTVVRPVHRHFHQDTPREIDRSVTAWGQERLTLRDRKVRIATVIDRDFYPELCLDNARLIKPLPDFDTVGVNARG